MNVLIVEDELHTAKLLQEIIEEDSDFMVVEKLESIVDAVDYLSKHQNNLDLLFFDIQLADGHSFEIFNHIDVTIPIVFCTAYDEYSMNAIKNNGIDYVLKPIKEKDIQEALHKYKKLFAKSASYEALPINFAVTTPNSYQQHFLTQSSNKTFIIKVDDIAFFTVQNEMVYLFTFEGKRYPLFKKLEYIESVCDPNQFFRINRQMLINRKGIVSFEPYFNRKIVITLNIKHDQKPIVSRLKVTPFKEWLEQ
ncbi:MAG: LytTR family DNA-binding domain-containing protein [Bacteroidota bacterium]